MQAPIKKKILMLIGDFVEDYEAMAPFHMMQMMGNTCHLACPDKKKGEKVKSAVHDNDGDQTYCERRGHDISITMDWNSMKVEEFDALILPGGRHAEYLRMNPKIIEIVSWFMEKNKPIACMSHGVQMLSPTKMLKGRTLTTYPAVAAEVEMSGGVYKKMELDESMVEGNLVTAVAWPGIHSWMANFVKVLGMSNI
jgi:protease I